MPDITDTDIAEATCYALRQEIERLKQECSTVITVLSETRIQQDRDASLYAQEAAQYCEEITTLRGALAQAEQDIRCHELAAALREQAHAELRRRFDDSLAGGANTVRKMQEESADLRRMLDEADQDIADLRTQQRRGRALIASLHQQAEAASRKMDGLEAAPKRSDDAYAALEHDYREAVGLIQRYQQVTGLSPSDVTNLVGTAS